MKQTFIYTLGYLGYFMVGLIAVRAALQGDNFVFVMTSLGSLFLMIYVSLLEKRTATPKYAGYIKVALVLAFFVTLAFALQF